MTLPLGKIQFRIIILLIIAGLVLPAQILAYAPLKHTDSNQLSAQTADSCHTDTNRLLKKKCCDSDCQNHHTCVHQSSSTMVQYALISNNELIQSAGYRFKTFPFALKFSSSLNTKLYRPPIHLH